MIQGEGFGMRVRARADGVDTYTLGFGMIGPCSSFWGNELFSGLSSG